MTRNKRNIASVLAGLLLVVLAPGVSAGILTSFVTGETPTGAQVIFKATFDPTVMDSGVVSVAVTEIRPGVGLDGIDFVPGTLLSEVVVGSPSGKAITHYDVTTGATLADIVADTDAVVPPPAPGTSPSTVLSIGSHVYYVENQFGFGTTTSHRIMRKPFVGGPEVVVFDAADPDPDTKVSGVALKNFEGLEVVGDRLYFFAQDPGDSTKRALMSIKLDGAGVWDHASTPKVEIGSLAQTPGGTDGSDELDFDAFSGLLFGTNIFNGEVIAFDPFASTEFSSLGATHFIDGSDVAAGAVDGLGLLARDVDGIRSDGAGNLIFTGRGGVIGAIDIAGVTAGADDGDITRLYDSVVEGTGYIFDDLTPVVPEPATVALMMAGLAGLGVAKRRKPLRDSHA